MFQSFRCRFFFRLLLRLVIVVGSVYGTRFPPYSSAFANLWHVRNSPNCNSLYCRMFSFMLDTIEPAREHNVVCLLRRFSYNSFYISINILMRPQRDISIANSDFVLILSLLFSGHSDQSFSLFQPTWSTFFFGSFPFLRPVGAFTIHELLSISYCCT